VKAAHHIVLVLNILEQMLGISAQHEAVRRFFDKPVPVDPSTQILSGLDRQSVETELRDGGAITVH